MKQNNGLLKFAKGQDLPKIYLWIDMFYNNGQVTAKSHSIYPQGTNDMIILHVAGLTPEQIKHFDSMDKTGIIEAERHRISKKLFSEAAP